MELQNALRTALELEKKVRAVYAEAAAAAGSELSRALFEMLEAEEVSHAEFLQRKLDDLAKDAPLPTSRLPPVGALKYAAGRMRRVLSGKKDGALPPEAVRMTAALRLEREMAAFYRIMAESMTGPDQKLFAHFLNIEERHVALVCAELESLREDGTVFPPPAAPAVGEPTVLR